MFVCLCVCRVGCCSGPGCFPPWDTEDRTDPRCSPSLRPRLSRQPSRRCWTTRQSQRSRWVFTFITRGSVRLLSVICRLYLIDYMNILYTDRFLSLVSISHLIFALCWGTIGNIPRWWLIGCFRLLLYVVFCLVGCTLSGNGLFQDRCPGGPQSFKQRHQHGNQLPLAALRARSSSMRKTEVKEDGLRKQEENQPKQRRTK